MTNTEQMEKNTVFARIEASLKDLGFAIEHKDSTRPWGGFFVIREEQAQTFSDVYFKGISTDTLRISGKLSPKILVVAPNCRLSWQYHFRRAEIWSVIEGPVAVSKSKTDEETLREIYQPTDIIKLEQGERHRLIGLDNWGVLAEIWQHTNAGNPSDEDDIVRVQDDYGRR